MTADQARIAELEAVVEAQRSLIERLEPLAETFESQRRLIVKLEARVAELERRLGQNSGNSGLPPSRDPAAERKRQADERAQKSSRTGGVKRRPGKQRGSRGSGPAMSATPDEIVDHRPERCGRCHAELGAGTEAGFRARPVIEVPVVAPTVTEHRAHERRCGCGHLTKAPFPSGVSAPVSYGPRARAVVVYLLARQHLPGRRVAETMADLFGLNVSTGTIDSIYTQAARRLAGFIAALVALLRSLPVLHADETTDRIGTKTCWMHVTSTSAYTLIHASVTRGTDAIVEAGVLIGYQGVVIHDRLAMYWKLKAKHGLCGAHLLRDLADVDTVATQKRWATGLACLLVEINAACDDARARGLKQLAPVHQRAFAARYDTLVAAATAANPEPAHRKRDYLERRSHNLAVAFATHHRPILAYMYDLDIAFTNNQAERDLRPTKLSVNRPWVAALA